MVWEHCALTCKPNVTISCYLKDHHKENSTNYRDCQGISSAKKYSQQGNERLCLYLVYSQCSRIVEVDHLKPLLGEREFDRSPIASLWEGCIIQISTKSLKIKTSTIPLDKATNQHNTSRNIL